MFEGVHKYENIYHVTLLLNPHRHFMLLAAKVHWTICLPLATSGGGLTFASLRVSYVFFNVGLLTYHDV